MNIVLYDDTFKISHRSCMITFHKNTCRTVLDRLQKLLVKYPTLESLSLQRSEVCRVSDSFLMTHYYSGNNWTRYDIQHILNFLKLYTKDKDYIKYKDKNELKKELLTINTFVLNDMATNIAECEEAV